MEYISYYNSPIGKILLCSDGQYLTGLYFENQKYYASSLNDDYIEKEIDVFIQTKQWLDCYFNYQIPQFIPALNIKTTDFRKQVYNILLNIPYGKTLTYGDISNILCQEYGYKSMSARAVGNAVGHNPISIIIPCHRVIGKNNKLTGYAAGIDIKKQLLLIEKQPIL